MPRRERAAVVAAILRAIEEHVELHGEDARVTRVATTANLPYDRLVVYLEHLAATGLVTDAKKPRLTEKGREFLRQHAQWTELLGRFGLH